MDLLTTVKIQLVEILTKACTICWFKIPVAIIVGMAGYLFGVENHASLLMLLVLIIFDMITAIMAEWKRGRAIESRKALKTATKTVVYGIFASGGHLTEQIVPGATFLDNAVISFLAITELISIVENIGHMGYAIPKKLLNRLEDLREK